MTRPLILIPMAGRGQRFIDAGYEVPKFALQVRGRSLLSWAVGSISQFAPDAEFRFVWTPTTQSAHLAEGAIKKVVAERDLRFVSTFELESPSRGQADTVQLALNYSDIGRPLVIWNVDTFLLPNSVHRDFLMAAKNAIYCFTETRDMPYSWVSLDERGEAINVKEKVKISDLASIGLYQWESCELFKVNFEEDQKKDAQRGELYVAPMYNQLIMSGIRVEVPLLDRECVIVLGTPAEYELWRDKGSENREPHGRR